jgi:hypothetical protein
MLGTDGHWTRECRCLSKQKSKSYFIVIMISESKKIKMVINNRDPSIIYFIFLPHNKNGN